MCVCFKALGKAAARFADKAKATHYKHVASVYAVFSHEQFLWCVSELPEVGSCQRLLIERGGVSGRASARGCWCSRRRQGLEESVVGAILKQALDGLAYLHARKWLHRDVCAANLLVCAGGIVKVRGGRALVLALTRLSPARA